MRTNSKARRGGACDALTMNADALPDIAFGLAAAGPDPAIGDAAKLFAPLIGDWRMSTVYTPIDEPREEWDGFWSFRWGLGGRAVYDVIGFRPAGSPPETPHRTGITVRFYDLALGTWRQVWVGVPRGVVCEFAVRGEDGRIVIDGAPSAMERLRWSFESIDAEAFEWEGRQTRDGGATWSLTQTISGRR